MPHLLQNSENIVDFGGTKSEEIPLELTTVAVNQLSHLKKKTDDKPQEFSPWGFRISLCRCTNRDFSLLKRISNIDQLIETCTVLSRCSIKLIYNPIFPPG